MSDTDLVKLYSQRILRLAASIPHAGRLEAPTASAAVRAPLCGSTVTVDLHLDGTGRITGFAQDVKACALGQAAASVVGAHAIGRDHAEILRARAELKAMLTEDGPPPAAPFEELETLRPAAEFRNRHASILLCLDATLAAMEGRASAAAT
ncbi:iron-sulfur cluster assembly scaffold protein [Mangrovicoccus algicola]|uniref:Iron-sulfur cluster assembly scaffold protein n=1 Tax=Mangrovicoccus algicola TaxID=2771008 RepID=A0A8J7CU15_9RHOB|nr:iron-sulfur cluster assembly scaffold protein [Mangrovicoccus algicola]MBE3637064.1 iron-sulfur cluster assembly scaffold protein [Mangrovicoccus algicola]